MSDGACVLGCKMLRLHLVECEGVNDSTCRGCLPRRADRGRLCHRCYRRLELMLTDAPVVYRWLTGNLGAGQQASRAKQEHERRSGGEKGVIETPVPVKIDILDTRDLLADQLTEWVDDWVQTNSLAGPSRHTPKADARFLLMWLPTMVREEWIGDWWEALAETMSQAHALAPWRPAVRRLPKVPCPGCGETNLVIYGGESDVSCQSCGIMMTEERFGLWEQVLREEQGQVVA